jgi:hypothetical protein
MQGVELSGIQSFLFMDCRIEPDDDAGAGRSPVRIAAPIVERHQSP